MISAWCTLAGPKGENQDVILPPFEVDGNTWCAIADGVGSSSNGGLAARISTDVVSGVSGNESMREVFTRVLERLSSTFVADEAQKAASTTLTVLRLYGTRAYVGHVGDTRISHYRGSGVMSRTKDQTEVQKLVDDKVLSKKQAARYPRRNVLLSAMSPRREFDLYELDFSLEKGDRILLTTDGFHSKLLRGSLADISAMNPVFSNFWDAVNEALVQKILDDDASCLAIEID